MNKEELHDTRMTVLLSELYQARGALDSYRQLLGRSVGWGALLMLALLLLGYTKWLPMAALALPFVVVFLVVQYGHLKYLVIYGRAHVAELENKINSEVGETLLISESVESKRSPLGEPHFLGITTGNMANIFSVMKIHYLIVCLMMFIAGVLRTLFILKQPDLRPVEKFGDLYIPLLFIWALANVIYLIWFFQKGEDERNLIAAIRKAYQSKAE
jgi:hypothetical protein